jgi:hypothetical protein
MSSMTLLSAQRALDRIGELKSTLQGFEHMSAQPAELNAKIRSYSDLESLAKGAGLPSFRPLVEKQAGNREGPLDESEARQMIDSCDQLRFRIVAVALGGSAKHFIGAAGGVSQMGPIVRGVSGLTYAALGRALIILVPDLKTKLDADLAAQDLLNIYNSPQGQRLNWILDFSAVKTTPSIVFMGLLKAYHNDLARIGAGLSLVWLKTSVVPERLRKQLGAILELKELGGYFFSGAAVSDVEDDTQS